MSNLKKLYKINPDYLIQKIKGQTTLFDATSSKLYTLNETSAIILTGIQLQWDINKIVKKISERFSVDEYIIENDVKDCLKDFIERKIIILQN